MSCHGCRVLRKRCGESCVLRPCLESIEPPEAKARATLFVSKFFGRGDLFNFISSVPRHKRTALFQSLLFEAVGRTVNPVNGAIGLLSTGNWHLCQAGVRTVLAGGTPTVLVNNSQTPEPEGSGVSQAARALSAMMIGNQIPLGNCSLLNLPPPSNLMIASSASDDEQDEPSLSYMPAASSVSKVSMSLWSSNGEEPKLLNLLI